MELNYFKINFLGVDHLTSYIRDKSEAADAIYWLRQNEILFGLDIETAALPEYRHLKEAPLSPHLANIRLLQIFDGKQCVVFDLHTINDFSIFKEFLETKRFIAHNAMFELMFLKKAGVTSMNIGCTYILAKLLFHAIYPDDSGISASLEYLVKQILKVELVKAQQTSDWSVRDLTFEQVNYAALDAVSVLYLANKLANILTKYSLSRTYQLCKYAQHPLANIQLNGITLDSAQHVKCIDQWRADLYLAKKEVLQLTGLTDTTSAQLADWLEEHLEPKILSYWPRTESGKLSTDAHTFADFSYLPIVEPFLKYQKAKTLTSTFGYNLLHQINPATKRIHAHYNLCGARTGRLSSSHPNLQNMPARAGLRENFIAAPGHVFVCADFNQIELRVAAEVSQDQEMLKAYRLGLDLHALTASRVSRRPIESIGEKDPDRQMAKAINFGLLFGLGAKKFAHYARKSYKVEMSQDQVEDAINTFRDTYSGYRAWQLLQAENAATSLLVRTPCGKLRKLPADNTYGNSMNHPVQGGAAEAMLYSLVYLNKNLADFPEVKLINTVHDEILLEVPDDLDYIKLGKGYLERCMEAGFLAVFPNASTNKLVKVKVGANWGEAK